MATYTRQAARRTLSWTPGEKGNPTAEKAFRVSGLSLDHEFAIAVENGNVIGQPQTEPPRPGGRAINMSFTSEIRGSDTADVPPPEMSHLRACGFSETASGSAPSIVYAYEHDDLHFLTDTPTGDTDPVQIIVNDDRLKRIGLVCVGNVLVNFTAGQLPTMTFTMRGNVSAGSAEAAVATLDPNSSPVPVQGEAMTIGGVGSLIISQFTYDSGNIVDERPDLNGVFGFSGPALTGKNPVSTVVIEAPPTGTIDFEALYYARTEIDIAIAHNTGAAIRQKLAIAFSGILTQVPQLGELNGKLVYNLTMAQSTETGADKFKMTWT